MLEYLKDELPEEDFKDFHLSALDLNYVIQSRDIRISSTTMADTIVYLMNVLLAEIKRGRSDRICGKRLQWRHCQQNGLQLLQQQSRCSNEKGF